MEENLGSPSKNHMKGRDSKSGGDVTIELESVSRGENNAPLVKTDDDFPSGREFSHIKVKVERDNVECQCSDRHIGKSKVYITAETDAEHDATIGVDDFTLVKTEDDSPSEQSHIKVKVEHDDNMECSDHHTVKSKDCVKVETDNLAVKKWKYDRDEVACLSGEIPDRPKKAKSGGIVTENINIPEHIGASPSVSRREHKTGLGKTYSCYVCNYESKFKSKLIIHTRGHTGEKPFSCDHCDYRCSSVGHLRKHMMSHTGEKPFSCDFCDSRCRTAQDLRRHMMTHTGEKPYSCNSCDYRSTRPGDLTIHTRTHTGEKPFSCNSCDYICSTASHLRSHMSTHTGEKPFSCDFCHYRCSRAGDLRRHMKTHTGEKPHSCNSCDYRCSRAGDLRRHMRTHRGE